MLWFPALSECSHQIIGWKQLYTFECITIESIRMDLQRARTVCSQNLMHFGKLYCTGRARHAGSSRAILAKLNVNRCALERVNAMFRVPHEIESSSAFRNPRTRNSYLLA